jgi:hypothetical protein
MSAVRAVALTTALGLLAAGCAQTHNIGVPVAEADLAKMRTQLNGKRAAAAYFERQRPERGAPPARRTVIEGTVYVDPFVVRMVDDGKEQSIPHAQVSMIQHVDHRLGMAQGAGIGAGIGVLLGGVGGYVVGEDCDPQEFMCFNRVSLATGLGVTLGVIGMLAGALSGSSSGAIDDWVFEP